tara:strand:- start:78 stop:680 length:603 start_codon:yes stop_codon:yes gene_type:complete
MRYALLLLIILTLHPLALYAQEPGFSPDPQSAYPTSLTGRWINEFYFAQPSQTPRQYWQIIEFLSDGSTRHSYFSSNPTAQPATPYTSIISNWQVGSFIDPQVGKSTLSVIRLKPTQQINYDINRNQFQHIRGNFGAQFRRYALSPDGATLTLSELVVLEVPGNIVISFPPTARDMIFSRMFTQPSAVAPTSWGRIKQIR